MKNSIRTIALGGGCFWCTEAVFKILKGITAVKPGYAGGTTKDPTYEQVSSGATGHAEVVYLEYDPEQIDFRDILTVFFASHDPSVRDRQGGDVGTQYRSAIFYETPEQKTEIDNFIKELNSAAASGQPIVTEVAPLTHFYPAELYHQNYFAKHGTATYCQLVINPKLEKVQKQFANLLKTNKENNG